jgi:hypothetical protein
VVGDAFAVGLGVAEGLNALEIGVVVAVGHGRDGSADSGQGGPVRIRGGSSGERWRSGPVRSLMAQTQHRYCWRIRLEPLEPLIPLSSGPHLAQIPANRLLSGIRQQYQHPCYQPQANDP